MTMTDKAEMTGLDAGQLRPLRSPLAAFSPAKIKACRIAAKVSQAEAAKCLGVSRPTVIALEQGKRGLTQGELDKLAALYGLDEKLRPKPLQLPQRAGVKDIPALLVEIHRLRVMEHEYHDLLLSCLRVMRQEGDMYFAGGNGAGADCLQKLADAGLMEIITSSSGLVVAGALTAAGKAKMEK